MFEQRSLSIGFECCSMSSSSNFDKMCRSTFAPVVAVVVVPNPVGRGSVRRRISSSFGPKSNSVDWRRPEGNARRSKDRANRSASHQSRMVAGHVAAVVILPQFDVSRGNIRLENFIGFFVVERIRVSRSIAQNRRPGGHRVFGHFHLRAKFLRIEQKCSVLTRVETIGDGHEQFFVEFERWRKLKTETETWSERSSSGLLVVEIDMYNREIEWRPASVRNRSCLRGRYAKRKTTVGKRRHFRLRLLKRIYARTTTIPFRLESWNHSVFDNERRASASPMKLAEKLSRWDESTRVAVRSLYLSCSIPAIWTMN